MPEHGARARRRSSFIFHFPFSTFHSREAFTLIEMLVVMAIIATLAGMLTGVILYARNLSIRVQCQQNLHQIGEAVSLLVLSNNGFSSIRTSQKSWFGRLIAADPSSGMTFPFASEVARAYGITGMRIENQNHLEADVRRVLETPGPVVCDVMTIPDETRQPRVASVQRADGSMVSRPLEDLFPFLDRQELKSNMMIPLLED